VTLPNLRKHLKRFEGRTNQPRIMMLQSADLQPTDFLP
jgi:hypothetical protein